MRRGFLACNVCLAALLPFGGAAASAQDSPSVETATVEADAVAPGAEHQRHEPIGQGPDGKAFKRREPPTVRTGSRTAPSPPDDL
ncbi:MAG: hypothetical protein JXA69_11650, partial [Phycisphaerae bacterium]|nr:hypothetical protein [Phycisphaerae bacterium]